MELKNEEILVEQDDQAKESSRPTAWRIDDDGDLKEEELERGFVNSEKANTVREGQGAGGQSFGENNLTPSANDKNNPSQYAGNTNAYFDRTEPSEEHPEYSNFKNQNQEGAPDYDKALPTSDIKNEMPKPEKVERGNGENDRPHKGESYQEGTADNDETNIPGPNEVPDQQKVGEDVDGDDRDDIET